MVNSNARRARLPQSGFTLIELLVVMSIIALLLTMAMPRYFHSIDAAKESVLRENLRTMRDAIDKFYADTGKYPDALDVLVQKRYLRAVPIDPITESSQTWITLAPPDASKGLVFDVKSSADGNGRNGASYREM